MVERKKERKKNQRWKQFEGGTEESQYLLVGREPVLHSETLFFQFLWHVHPPKPLFLKHQEREVEHQHLHLFSRDQCVVSLFVRIHNHDRWQREIIFVLLYQKEQPIENIHLMSNCSDFSIVLKKKKRKINNCGCDLLCFSR